MTAPVLKLFGGGQEKCIPNALDPCEGGTAKGDFLRGVARTRPDEKSGAKVFQPPVEWAEPPGKKPTRPEPLDITKDPEKKAAVLDNPATVEERVRDVHRFLATAIRARMQGFNAAAKALALDVAEVEGSTLAAFVEKAMGLAATLLAKGIVLMLPGGAPAIIGTLIEQAFSIGGALLGTAAKNEAKGQVNVAAFLTKQESILSLVDTEFERTWNPIALGELIRAAPDPATLASRLVQGASNASDRAFVTQWTSTFSAWTTHVRAASGPRSSDGRLVIEADFGPGCFSVSSATLAGVGSNFLEATGAVDHDGQKITLRQLMSDGHELPVAVVDSAGEKFEWDPAAQAIATSDERLMHHQVNRYGRVKWGVESPVVNAHRFLFETLGAQTLAQLGATT